MPALTMRSDNSIPSLCSFDLNRSNSNPEAFDLIHNLHSSGPNREYVGEDSNSRSYLQLCFAVDDCDGHEYYRPKKQQVLELSLTMAFSLQNNSEHTSITIRSNKLTSAQSGPEQESLRDFLQFSPEKCNRKKVFSKPICLLAVKCSKGFSPFSNSDEADSTETSCSEVASLGDNVVFSTRKTVSSKSVSMDKAKARPMANRRPNWSSTLASKEHRKKNPESNAGDSSLRGSFPSSSASTGSYGTSKLKARQARQIFLGYENKQDTSVPSSAFDKPARRSSASGQISGDTLDKPPRPRRNSLGASQFSPHVSDAWSSSHRPRTASSLNGSNGLFALAKRISRKNGSSPPGLKKSQVLRVEVSEHSQARLVSYSSTTDDLPLNAYVGHARQPKINNNLSFKNKNGRHLDTTTEGGGLRRHLIKSASVRMKRTLGQSEDMPTQRQNRLGNYLMRTSKGKSRGTCSSCGI